ncbi:cell division protein CpoB [Rosenbergiella australiborealis]|uniref:Cell division coordinator CpoB n=2 Tax=Rosenbergiella TaxID=1356488 RepID=A0ABS5T5K5_9GAMM|nr:cell division protein CpoB [Rosenbergiella australiborealis]MBT0727038.1 cell division protein CpoB [Rosenbergiella australiborealis]
MISNFRLHALGLSLLIGVAAVPAAHAQASISSAGSGSTEDRVTTLERISNAQSQLLQQLQQQLSDTQNDIDSLRGEIQQNTYQLNQVVDRQKQLYQQIDTLSSNSAATSAANGADNSQAAAASTSTPDTSSAGQVGTQTGDVNKDYNAAVDLVLKQNKPDDAMVALQAWVKKYPDSTYQPNANFWLGQLYYNKGQKDDAAYYFATVVKNYPKSPKSAEALLKIGVIMKDKNQLDKAKAVWQQVIQLYPNTPSAKAAQKALAE